jgi:hypothetical protein
MVRRGQSVFAALAPPARVALGLFACATAVVGAPACKDEAKESAARAAKDAADLGALVDKDIGEVERGLPVGASKLGALVADGSDPRQDVAGVRSGLLRIRRQVPDLNIAKSTFFALADPSGVAIRNDLEEDVMAGQNLVALFPALARATDGLVTTTGSFPNAQSKNGPDEDWIAAAPVKRADAAHSTGALLVTGWSYRYFARHLQESLKDLLLEQAKAAGSEGKLPVYYVALFDRSGVYSAPLTPAVDEQALVKQDLVAKTAAGPAQGTVTIADRPIGFAAQRTPKMAADTGVVVLRSD